MDIVPVRLRCDGRIAMVGTVLFTDSLNIRVIFQELFEISGRKSGAKIASAISVLEPM